MGQQRKILIASGAQCFAKQKTPKPLGLFRGISIVAPPAYCPRNERAAGYLF